MLRVVVTDNFSIEERQNHVGSATLCQSPFCIIASNGIISINNSLSVLVQTCNQVKGIVREKSSGIESFGD